MTALLKRPPSEAERLYRPRASGPTRGGFNEFDVVRLTRSAETFDGVAVPAGTVGAIVTVLDGGRVFDVEFSDPCGIACVSADEIAPR